MSPQRALEALGEAPPAARHRKRFSDRGRHHSPAPSRRTSPPPRVPGSAVTLGATVSAFHSDYGQRTLDGGTLYLDANLYRRIGVEAEARTLSLHSDDGLRQSTYLVGPRFSSSRRTLRPYTKLLAGRGTFQFPYHYAHGSYFVVAAGTGLDWHLNRSATVRVIDFEYQRWPQFTFGELRPYGISTGLSLRLFLAVLSSFSREFAPS